MSAASTEHRTSRRLAAARLARPSSRSLSAAVALVAFALAVDLDAARAALASSFGPAFAAAGAPGSFASLWGAGWHGSTRALMALLGPLLAATVVGVIAAGVAQRVASASGPSDRASGDRPSAFDLGARVRGLLAAERAADAAFGLLSLAVLSLVAWLTLAPNVRGLLALPAAELVIAAPQLLELFGALVLRVTLAGLALGGLDYVRRRVRHAASLRMTRRELLDEQREQYGDPNVRRARASRSRERNERGGRT